MMETSHHNGERAGSRPLHLTVTAPAAVAAIGIAAAAGLCGFGRYWEAAGVVAITLAVGFVISARVSVEGLLIIWVATTPVASFYARLPFDRALVTYDRALFGLVVLLLIWRGLGTKRRGAAAPGGSGAGEQRSGGAEVESPLLPLSSAPLHPISPALKFQIAWAVLAALASMSVALKSTNVGYATRLAVDTFWLPLVAFYLARYRFEAASRGRMLMLAFVALTLFLFATGAFEMATGANLFPYRESDLVRDGELRVNGPFASDSSYAIICAITFLFLRAAPSLLRVRMDNSARLLWWLALAASLAGSLLSLFRAVAVAIVAGWILFEFLSRPRKEQFHSGMRSTRILAPTGRRLSRSRFRPWALGGIALSGALVLTLIVVSPFFGQRLASARAIYGRLATWQAAVKITLEHPAVGVGLANYTAYFGEKYAIGGEMQESVGDTRAAAAPHNNFLWIAAELGLVGLALFAVAHFQIAVMGYRALRRAVSTRQRIAAACFLALIVAYWVPGFTLASGEYSDLNLYFFFMLGLLSNVRD